MKKYKDYLEEKKEEEKVFEYTDNHELNEMRQLVEDMTKWMSVGSNAVKTSQKMLHDFKDVMGRANAVVRDNKLKRGDY